MALTEKAWQAQVTKLAALYGWRVYHTHDSRRSTEGFPDLCMVRRARLLFAELKTDTGRLTPAQAEWLHDLAGVEESSNAVVQTGLWRPRDLEAVQAALTPSEW